MASKQASIDRIENVPLTEQARSAILEAIVDKRFDERLPSEEALAEMLSVSRTTINAHVRPSTMALQRMVGFDGLLKEKGYQVAVEVEWKRAAPRKEFVDAFSLDADESSLLTEKSYFADGKLAIFVSDAMPWSNLKDQNFAGEVPASIFEFSSREWAIPVDHVVAEILPVVKRNAETTRVPVAKGEAITRLHEYHYGSRGNQLAVSMVDVDTEFIHFEVFRRL